MPESPLNLETIRQQTFVARVEHHATLRSTNDRAAECAGESPRAEELPLLIVADEQTAGRGRGANRWWTGPGSLAMSLLLAPEKVTMPPDCRAPLVSLAAALAVVETVAPLAAGHDVGLHWPNDVFAAGRKLAGILVEVLPGGRHIVGIGMNTNHSPADVPAELRETSIALCDLTGRPHELTAVIVAVLQHLEAELAALAADPQQTAARADAVCLQRGKLLTVETGRQTMTGRCAGIAADGALWLDTADGRRAVYSAVVREAREGIRSQESGDKR